MEKLDQIDIAAQSGAALALAKGLTLRVIDPAGEQVSDIFACNAADTGERLSSGRSIDYAGRIYLTSGDVLYSNRSRPLFTITGDTVGRHDFLLTPCSPEMFKILYGHEGYHPSCLENLASALAPHGIAEDEIVNAFNVFMNVEVDGSGAVHVRPPLSRSGDHIDLRAEMNLIVGATACSAEQSNNGSFKPIRLEIYG